MGFFTLEIQKEGKKRVCVGDVIFEDIIAQIQGYQYIPSNIINIPVNSPWETALFIYRKLETETNT